MTYKKEAKTKETGKINKILNFLSPDFNDLRITENENTIKILTLRIQRINKQNINIVGIDDIQKRSKN